MKINKHLEVTRYSSKPDLKISFNILKVLFYGYYEGRSLGRQLFIRELKAMFRGSFLGIAWAFVPPLITALTWTVLSNKKIVNFGETDIPYPLFILIGTLLWQSFTEALVGPNKAMNINKGIITKLNFPRQAILLSSWYEISFQVLLKLVVLIVALVWFQIPISFNMLLAIFPILVLMLFGFSLGILLSPVSLMISDIMRALPFLLQFVMYLFPVIYPVPDTIDSWSDSLLFENPLAVTLCNARDLLTTNTVIEFGGLGISLLFTFVLFIVANYVFKISQAHLTSRLGS